MVHSKKEPRNTDYRAYFEGKRLSYFTSKFMVTILCHLFKLALAGSGDFVNMDVCTCTHYDVIIVCTN